MIKVSELRTGNLILGDDGKPEEVYNIKDDDRKVINFTILDGCVDLPTENPQGIPITDEWLERMGFEERYTHNSDGDEINYMKMKAFEDLLYRDGIFSLCCGSLELPHIEYVHQLQNLFYALTGKELEITPV